MLLLFDCPVTGLRMHSRHLPPPPAPVTFSLTTCVLCCFPSLTFLHTAVLARQRCSCCACCCLITVSPSCFSSLAVLPAAISPLKSAAAVSPAMSSLSHHLGSLLLAASFFFCSRPPLPALRLLRLLRLLLPSSTGPPWETARRHQRRRRAAAHHLSNHQQQQAAAR